MKNFSELCKATQCTHNIKLEILQAIKLISRFIHYTPFADHVDLFASILLTLGINQDQSTYIFFFLPKNVKGH